MSYEKTLHERCCLYIVLTVFGKLFFICNEELICYDSNSLFIKFIRIIQITCFHFYITTILKVK